LQLASRHPGDPRQLTLHDFLPDEKLREVGNLHDFAGMLVFDKWTCNTNGRQTLFFEQRKLTSRRGWSDLREPDPPDLHPPDLDAPDPDLPNPVRNGDDRSGLLLQCRRMDLSRCAAAGLYARNRVYEGVTSLDSFAPWLERLQHGITARALSEAAGEIPPEWYDDDYDAVLQLLEKLEKRKTRVPELIVSAKETTRQPFPFWS